MGFSYVMNFSLTSNGNKLTLIQTLTAAVSPCLFDCHLDELV
jgi:hypothetical protein